MSIKFKTLLAALLIAVGVFGAMTVSAQALDQAQLNAMIASLQQQIAQLTGGATTGAATGVSFTKDLTIGSRGADVTNLQTFLEGKMFLTMPVGVAKGYFGALTQKALAAYQAANGITPAAGYFGPKTRAAVNAAAVVVVPGTPTTPTTPANGITTPGVEGSMTVTVNATPGSGKTIREGDTKVSVLGLKIEAKSSDLDVQRVKVDLGASTIFYTKLFSKIYLLDGSTVLAESDLNSSEVVKDGSAYYITLSGFHTIVPKDGTKVLTLALDAKSSIDSTYDAATTYGLAIPQNGVRSVDGAGINQEGPSSALARRTVTIDADALVDAATLKISYNSSSLSSQEIVADQGTSEDEYDMLSLLNFNMKAEKDDVTVTDLVATITRGGNTTSATATTAYLYEGDTLIGSATVEGTSATAMTATFSDIDYVVTKDSTKVLTLKADIVDAGSAVTTFVASVTSGANVSAENSDGTNVAESGTATGNTLSIVKSGLQVSLVSAPKLVATGAPQNSTANSFSTSTLTATFNVKVKAVGGDVILPTVASSTPMFSKTGATNSFKVYVDGVAGEASVATSTSYTIPSTCSTSGLTNGCTLAEGSEVTIPVTYTIPGRTAASAAVTAGNYAVQLVKVNYGATVTTSTFMADQLDWRTNEVYFP